MSNKGLNKQFKDMVAKVCEDEGCRVYEIVRRGTHFAINYLMSSGRTRFYVFSGTPSDKRSYLNTKCGLRRDIREQKGLDMMKSSEDLQVAQDMERT